MKKLLRQILFRIPRVVGILVCLVLLNCTAAKAFAQKWDYWIQKPEGWTDKRGDAGSQPVRQFIEPGENAFIEIYTENIQSPGIETIANTWETNAKRRGLPYVQERLSSIDVNTHPAPGILREYRGNNNGVPISAIVLCAYHNGRVFTVLGVWVQNSTFGDSVRGIVSRFRFSPPNLPQTAHTSGLCNAIIGKWHWFNGNEAEFRPDGTMGGFSQHTWRCTDTAHRIFTVTWNNGQWIDTLTLSMDGNRLEGKNQIGHRVWATRKTEVQPPATATKEMTMSAQAVSKPTRPSASDPVDKPRNDHQDYTHAKNAFPIGKTVSDMELNRPETHLFVAPMIFRQHAQSDMIRTLKKFNTGRALNFISDSRIYREIPDVWSYFFSCCFVLGGNVESKRPVFAYYNPFLDGILLTQWESIHGEPELISADLMSATGFSGQPLSSGDVPFWVTHSRNISMMKVLDDQCYTVSKIFRERYPAQGNSIADISPGPDIETARDRIERNALSVLNTIHQIHNPESPFYNASLIHFLEGLHGDNRYDLQQLLPADLPGTAEALFQIPLAARKRIMPFYALVSDQSAIVLLAQQDTTCFYITLIFDRSVGGNRLKTVSVNSLGREETSK